MIPLDLRKIPEPKNIEILYSNYVVSSLKHNNLHISSESYTLQAYVSLEMLILWKLKVLKLKPSKILNFYILTYMEPGKLGRQFFAYLMNCKFFSLLSRA